MYLYYSRNIKNRCTFPQLQYADNGIFRSQSHKSHNHIILSQVLLRYSFSVFLPSFIMRKIASEMFAFYGGSIGAVALLVPILAHVPRNGGRHVLFHILFGIIVGVTIFFVPEDIQLEIFSHGGVLAIGTLLPIYQTVAAACRPNDSKGDDETWLQYWVSFGGLLYASELVHDLRDSWPNLVDWWYEFHFFMTLWLMLPFTDGATLLFESITKPYLAPWANRIKSHAEGWSAVVLTFINSSYMCLLWYSFVTLPEDGRRFLVIALGTVYPMAASIVAMIHHPKANINDTNCDDDVDEKADHTFWLTYWASYSLLIAAMDYLENFVGQIPLFHSVCACCTVYLLLPMFGGAEVIFRRILVPCTGQYENMLVRDAYQVKERVDRAIPMPYRGRVMEKMATIFKQKQT